VNEPGGDARRGTRTRPRPRLDVGSIHRGSIVVAIAALAALAVCLVVIRPFGPAMNDPDSAASVVFFQHLIGGHRLEAMVTTTPKPLLTLVYGITWSLTHDWSALTWETIVVFVVGVALAARLALTAGLPAAAGFIVVALVGWPELLLEVAHANSLPWAVAGWFLAGWALERRPARPWIAGIAIFLAALARVETFWLVGAATAAIVVLAAAGFAARRAGRPVTAMAGIRRLSPIVVGGVLALAVMCLHDWALTGNPFFWTGVPASYTAIVDPDLRPIGLGQFWNQIVVPHYRDDVPTILLAVVGVVALVRLGRRTLATGIVALVAGVVATLVLLSLRGVFVSDRYWEEADVAIRFAAAIGAGWLIRLAGRALRAILHRDPVPPRLRVPALAATGVIFALVLAWSVVARAEIEAPLATSRGGSSHLDLIEPRLGRILAGAVGAVVAEPGVELPMVVPGAARLVAPREDLLRIAAETGVPLTALADSFLAFRATTPGDVLRPGQWVFHDAAVDGRGGRYATLEVSQTTTVGALRFVPVFVDPVAGIWLLRIAGG